ncbi:hypothetical protein N473_07385 [Pseudoalteromonas luteoviolacea CPMOR-1]|uniref:Uncharacterized protein n=1 Tax=Pseudoalteromonas luteoviolacea CPMOR-1 TaxID=1365248 RepID=A0A167NGR6_9GAMM|nr:hypothetical protein [Pseudoalteromonas luteoviolacea]KZN68239.1 hypothetical protein N473_07385 [Pseudoalteromonas luteoviolacea CPMOR-1]
MNQHKSQHSVLEKINIWSADNTDSPSLLISQDDGSFHLGYYSGMGTSDNTPIEQLDPQYKATISQLYISGKLIQSGKAFTLYPGSDSFKKLVSVK